MTDKSNENNGHNGHNSHEHNHSDDDTFCCPRLDEPIESNELDPAMQSLNEALRISFSLLKWVMILLIIAYLFSGFYQGWVDESHVGIRFTFGSADGQWKVIGGKDEFKVRVLGPGCHWAWPEPIDRVVMVPTTVQRLRIEDAFWFQESPEDKLTSLDEKTPLRGGLVPGRDGSLLTGDRNIVHGKWAINYRISQETAALFVRNVSASSDPAQMLADAEVLVRFAAEQAIVGTMAQTKAEEFVRGDFDRISVKEKIQATLDLMESGIVVTQVLLDAFTPPLQVREAFQAVSLAESDKAKIIERASMRRTEILNGVAGVGHLMLLEAIDVYESAQRDGDQTVINKADAYITKLLSDRNFRKMSGIRGEVSKVIESAETYRTEVVTKIKGEQDRFLRLQEKFKDDPSMERITRALLLEDTRKAVFTGDVETYYLPRDTTEIRIDVNRDLKIKHQREKKKYEQEIKQGQRQ